MSRLRRLVGAFFATFAVAICGVALRPVSAAEAPYDLDGQSAFCNVNTYVEKVDESKYNNNVDWVSESPYPQAPFFLYDAMRMNVRCAITPFSCAALEDRRYVTYAQVSMDGLGGPTTTVGATAQVEDPGSNPWLGQVQSQAVRAPNCDTGEEPASEPWYVDFSAYWGDGVDYALLADLPLFSEFDGSYQTGSGALRIVQVRLSFGESSNPAHNRVGEACGPEPHPWVVGGCPTGGLDVGAMGWEQVADPFAYGSFPPSPQNWPNGTTPNYPDSQKVPPPALDCTATVMARLPDGRYDVALRYRILNPSVGSTDDVAGWLLSWRKYSGRTGAGESIRVITPSREVMGGTDPRDALWANVQVTRTVEPQSQGQVEWAQNSLGVWAPVDGVIRWWNQVPGIIGGGGGPADDDLANAIGNLLFLDASDQVWSAESDTTWTSSTATCVARIRPDGTTEPGSVHPIRPPTVRPPFSALPPEPEGGGGGEEGCTAGVIGNVPLLGGLADGIASLACTLGDLLGGLLELLGNLLRSLFVPTRNLEGDLQSIREDAEGKGPFPLFDATSTALQAAYSPDAPGGCPFLSGDGGSLVEYDDPTTGLEVDVPCEPADNSGALGLSRAVMTVVLVVSAALVMLQLVWAAFGPGGGEL